MSFFDGITDFLGDAVPALFEGAGDLFGMPGVGSAIAAGLNFIGSQDTNAQSAQNAANQMAFQRDMSNTAYQRATRDMQAAGLNPMLAYSQGGASTPIGAMPQVQNALGNAANSGVAAAQAVAQVKNLQESNTLIKAQVDATVADAAKKRAEAALTTAQTATEGARPENVRQLTSESVQRVVQSQAQTDRFAEQNSLTRAQAARELQEAETSRSRMFINQVERDLLAKEEPRVNAEMMMYGNAFGKLVPYLGPIGRVTGSGESLSRMLNNSWRR